MINKALICAKYQYWDWSIFSYFVDGSNRREPKNFSKGLEITKR